MRNPYIRVALGLAAIAVVAAVWILPSYAQQVQGTLAKPGMTEARVWINNRGRDEAIPVTWVGGDPRSPVPVTVQGTATVNGKVETIAARQFWEYREVSSTAAAALNALGNDGWEAFGVAPSGTVLLKRPK